MSADSPRRSSGCNARGMIAVPTIVPPQVVSDRSILDSAIGFINEVTLAHQPPLDPKDTIIWARFETSADISDPRFGEDWEIEGNVAPPLLLILGYGLGVQLWAIPANGEAVEVLSWRHGIVSALRILPTPTSTIAVEENGRADEPIDVFAEKRPLIALVDGSSTTGSQPQFCAVNFISLKTGAQVKTIKFKNPVIDIMANRSSVVITFHERIAIFDARTLEDRLSITTCYPSPGINPNPIALGPRWLAYAENKLLHSKRSGGGCDGDGVTSYTATVLNASKSLVKGLRELGEQVAAGLTGTSGTTGISKNISFDSGCGPDAKQSGIVTVIDIKNPLREYSPTSMGVTSSSNQNAVNNAIIAHFIAHSEAIVAMEFDNSGMLLVTADRRGHDFHVFRIQPNPIGSSLAAVHHLYILHRGDTSAKVQNITLTLDSRWVAVSTLRGTTHVFPITPYGGTMGVRTHSSLHVVNKLSRFHRSAGLSAEGRSNSPISHSESTTFTQSLQPYHNSTLPPFPRPSVVMPLAQLRQPFALGSPPGSTNLTGVKSVTGNSGSGSQRQRLSSLSDDSGKPLSVCAIFAKSRSWLLDPPNVTREAPHRMQRKAVDSLFIMAGHGALIQYDLDTKLASNVAKEKICDDTPIELEIEAKAQWNLGRRKEGSQELMPPLSPDNWLIKNRNSCMLTDSTRQYDDVEDRSESWLSQVEIITHAGPHRRLWMGPQFVFKTYNTPSGSNLSHVDNEAVEVGTSKSSTTAASEKLDNLNPLNMPLGASNRSSAVPVLIESGSYSSIEQSPKLMDRFRHDHLDSDFSIAHGDSRLKEDLADAMRESPSAPASTKDSGDHGRESAGSSDNVAFYDALTAEDDQVYNYARSASAVTLANVLPNIHSYDIGSGYASVDMVIKPKASIEKIVNPLGTVTTVTSCLTADVKTDILDEVVSQLAAEDTVIHENCDESLFRPVVAIFCDEKSLLQKQEEEAQNEQYQPPEIISSNLVVPVIAKEVNDELNKREKEKSTSTKSNVAKSNKDEERVQCDSRVFSSLNKNPKKLKKCNVKDSICVDDNEQCKSTLLINESQHEKNVSLVEIKSNECLKSSNVTKKILMTPTSQVVSKININKQKPVTNLIKSDDDVQTEISIIKENKDKETKLEIPQQLEIKKQSSSELGQLEFPKKKNNNSNLKNILVKEEPINETETKSNEENNGAKLNDPKGIVDDKIASEIGASFKITATDSLKAAQNEIITNKLENEKIKKNVDENTENDTILTSNTAPKEKGKKLKKSIATNKSMEHKVVTTTKSTVDQFVDSIDEINVNKDLNVTKVNDDVINKKPNSNLCEKTNKWDPILDSEKEQIKDVTLFTKKDSQFVVIPSSKENQTELHGARPIEKSSERNKEKDINITENAVLETSDFNLKLSENAPIAKKLCEIKTDKCLNSKLEEKRSDEKLGDNSQKEPLNNKPKKSDNSKTKAADIQPSKENLVETKNQNDETTEVVSLNVNPLKINKRIENVDKVQNRDEANEASELVVESKNTSDVKSKESLTQVLKDTNKDSQTNELSTNIKTKNKSENNTPAQISPKKKVKGYSKNELKKDADVSMDVPSNSSTLNKENTECKIRTKEQQNDSLNSKDNSNDKYLSQSSLGVWEKTNKIMNMVQQTSSLAPASAWKTLTGAEMINKNLRKSDSESIKVSLLSDLSKFNIIDKLLPELPTPNDMSQQAGEHEFPMLKSFDPLPPLPAFEPLQLLSENKSNSLKDISLINFESPLKENTAFQRRITPTPRGFTEENLILALCGSLHYENDQGQTYTESTELSPTFSSNHSSTAFEEASMADYKSLTENDDPYMSLEQSSQDTNTTTTNTTNEKFSSSTNSSGSEEIVIMEEKKMTKKQKRKKQLQLKELQKQKEQQQQREIDDEELRPLITMIESQIDQTTNCSEDTLPAILSKCNKNEPLEIQPIINSNTTDSDGPMPATTSDDNICPISDSILHNSHKIKTKKIEHKINLIAAIEAATSSSTSSAEESGVELGPRSPHDNDESLISVPSSISTSTIPLPIVATSHTTVGASKKKTKRRKR